MMHGTYSFKFVLVLRPLQPDNQLGRNVLLIWNWIQEVCSTEYIMIFYNILIVVCINDWTLFITITDLFWIVRLKFRSLYLWGKKAPFCALVRSLGGKNNRCRSYVKCLSWRHEGCCRPNMGPIVYSQPSGTTMRCSLLEIYRDGRSRFLLNVGKFLLYCNV